MRFKMKKSFKKAITLSLSILLSFTFLNCSNNEEAVSLPKNEENQEEIAVPLQIAVISDSHIYDSSVLGSSGSALQAYIATDRKMLIESEAIFDSAIEEIEKSEVKYLFIAGDLTKDGEKINHELLAGKLKKLEDETEIEVFVINGNHDISNQNAVKFDGDTTTAVETVNTTDFRTIYADFGYSQAVSKDTASLSYSADIGKNYRLIAIDSCIYNDNKENPHQETSGEFTEKRLTFVLNEIKKAKEENKTPIAMMHHGLVPHTEIQPTLFAEYLLNDYESVRKTLSNAGLNIAFTGHFHSQDAASAKETNATFYDIETGSLVTYPCPVRNVTLDKNKIAISTKTLDTVEGIDLKDYSSFSEYAKKFLTDGMYDTYTSFMPYILIQQGMASNNEEALAMTKQFLAMELVSGYTLENLLTGAFVAHYCGDEKMDAQTQQILAAIGAKAQNPDEPLKNVYALIYQVVTQLYTDSPTSDLNVSFEL